MHRAGAAHARGGGAAAAARGDMKGSVATWGHLSRRSACSSKWRSGGGGRRTAGPAGGDGGGG